MDAETKTLALVFRLSAINPSTAPATSWLLFVQSTEIPENTTFVPILVLFVYKPEILNNPEKLYKKPGYNPLG